jgi:hypothetical protein
MLMSTSPPLNESTPPSSATHCQRNLRRNRRAVVFATLAVCHHVRELEADRRLAVVQDLLRVGGREFHIAARKRGKERAPRPRKQSGIGRLVRAGVHDDEGSGWIDHDSVAT